MGKQICVLFIISIFTLMTFGCNNTVVKKDNIPIVKIGVEKPKVNCPENTIYVVDRVSIENTIIYTCLTESNRIEGKVIAFYADTRKIKAVTELREGLKVGKLVRWNKDGELFLIENYNDKGLMHGYSIIWENIGANKHCAIFNFSDDVLINLFFEYKNEKVFKVFKVIKGENPIELDTSKMTTTEIEYLNKQYTKIISKETKDLPIP